MALDYSNERWVRVYTRDTTTWKLLTWQARAVLLMILRKVDRAGVLDVGDDGIAGLAAVVEVPEDVVADALAQLERRGVVVRTGSAYVLPAFLAAQEAPASDKQRQAEARATRRARVMSAGRVVTARDDASRNVTGGSRNVTEPSRGVTDGHAASRGVTPRQDKTSQDEPSQERVSVVDAVPAPLALLPDEPPTVPRPAPALRLATVACAAINAATGSKYRPETEATLRLARALHKAGRTPAQVERVIAAKVAEWRGDAKMAGYLAPPTLLAAANFSAYLTKLDEGAPAGVNGTARSPARGQYQPDPTTVYGDGEQPL